MRVYRHAHDPDRLIIDVKDSPIMQSVLMGSEFVDEMEYDASEQWFSVTSDTYKRIRNQLSSVTEPFKREPATKKRTIHTRATENTVIAPPPPVPVQITIFRTTPTQTDSRDTTSNGTQTEEICQEDTKTVSEPHPPSQSPNESAVIAIPVAVQTTLPSPSAVPPIPVSEPGPIMFMPQSSNCPMQYTQSEAPSILSGYTNWKDVCVRRLAIRDMLLGPVCFLGIKKHPDGSAIDASPFPVAAA